MWLECVTDKAYPDREDLADDVVRVLREELDALLAAGAALVQFDEPVLTEVVFAGATTQRGRSCAGRWARRRPPAEELAFAGRLINRRRLAGLPRDRARPARLPRQLVAATRRVALRGAYRPLLRFFSTLPVGTFFLELCTPRAGELDALRDLPADRRIGLGVVNQKLDRVESVEEIVTKARKAIQLFGKERVLLTPDCGFATFADNPVASVKVAEEKLRNIARARDRLREAGSERVAGARKYLRSCSCASRGVNQIAFRRRKSDMVN